MYPYTGVEAATQYKRQDVRLSSGGGPGQLAQGEARWSKLTDLFLRLLRFYPSRARVDRIPWASRLAHTQKMMGFNNRS